MISSIVFAIHQLRPAYPFPPFRPWRLTRLGQVNLRCGSPLFQPSSRLSSVCRLTQRANSAPANRLHCLTHLESTLAKVYQNKQLKQPLELYTYEKMGGRVLWLNNGQLTATSKLDPLPSRPSHVRPIAAREPECNNDLRQRKTSPFPGNNSALPGV
jgi:hypothetical protein